MVVCGDLRWFVVVCGGLRWFVMVCGGLSYSHTRIRTADTRDGKLTTRGVYP